MVGADGLRRMTGRALAVALAATAGVRGTAMAEQMDRTPEFPGAQSRWHGFARHDFKVDGRAAIVVRPKAEAPGRPWIWRARFFGHQPQADRALLANGFHLVYTDVGSLYGAPAAVAHWNRFYELLVTRHGFSRRVALEGMSRGGLIVYNWAAENADKVACIYADAPVCDIRSWPRGRSPGDWKRCLAAYGLADSDVEAFRGNPIDRLGPLADADVPVLHICGAADTVVPVAENTGVLERRYRALGGRIDVILKPECGHHPHSLPDPDPIVRFVLDNTVSSAAKRHVMLRQRLRNARTRFANEKVGRVAFLGGSITFMEGYRPRVAETLKERFPDTAFEFINAGISSTCSTTGAFRLVRDVLSRGRVDLLFVEFAVNDNQDAAHTREQCVRGLEGIVRQARVRCPAIDVVPVYCVNGHHRESYLAGREPAEIAAHRRVAAHYDLPEVNLAAEVAERMRAGEFDWKRFGGCHPSAFGNDLYGATFADVLDRCARQPVQPGDTVWAQPLPPPIDPYGYAQARFVPLASLELARGWQLHEPDWSSIRGNLRGRFRGRALLCGTTPGAALTLPFEGSALALYVLAGPDAGAITVSVDGATPRTIDLSHRFSRGLHYPRTVVLADELAGGPHTATIKLAPPPSAGREPAARIVALGVNSPPLP